MTLPDEERSPQKPPMGPMGRMTPVQTWFMHIVIVASTITGLIYAWMKYFVESDDPFSVVNHPWQPTLLHLHIIVVPLLVYGLGWIASNHIGPKYQGRVRIARKSGLIMMVVAGIMVFSGYLLQVLTGEGALKWTAVLHWASSAVFVVGYLVHQVVKPR